MTVESGWTFAPPPRAETLGRGEVHVWRTSLEQPEPVLARLREILDDDERRRADRFSFEKGRRQFTVGRGLLRVLLGHYLAVGPAGLRFCYNPYGKPELVRDLGGDTLKFNLSHSGDLVFYAVSRDRELGVDVETIRPDFASEAIAERFFSPGERVALRGVRPELRARAFFACWTRKEAYIKAKGKGLSIALDSFEVSLEPERPPALIATLDDPDEAGRWSLHELDPGPGYAAALAVEGARCTLRYGTWTVA